jgi:phage FluMu protein Com
MWAIVRDIRCKKCGYNGVAEDQGLDGVPQDRIFKHSGNNAKGHLYFRCPSCNTVKAFSPYSFIHPAIKIAAGGILVAIIWGIIILIAK